MLVKVGIFNKEFINLDFSGLNENVVLNYRQLLFFLNKQRADLYLCFLYHKK